MTTINSQKRPFEDGAEECSDGSSSNKRSNKENEGRMKVFVRVRPESEKEINLADRNVVDVISNDMLIFDPPDEDEKYSYHGLKYKEIGKRQNKNINYNFDEVFGKKSTNIDVYDSTTKDLIKHFLDGYNCTIFAYGATGSGKTHTMLGDETDTGVIFYAVKQIYSSLDPNCVKQDLSVSYFEIYNETINDLLDPSSTKALNIRENTQRGVFVPNLCVHHPENVEAMFELLKLGNTNRRQKATDANSQSSRSHALLQISINRQTHSNHLMNIQRTKLSLVDLAGSERASVAYRGNREKSLQREGGNINKSLLALGQCINALTNQEHIKKGKFYVPYRGSKLTYILKDSLGGNCHTTMIATVSPSSKSYDDTQNTLAYADRATGIRFEIKRRVSISNKPHHYSQALDTLTKENALLLKENALLKATTCSVNENISSHTNLSGGSLNVLNSRKIDLETLFEEQNTLRRQLLEYESNSKKIEYKMMIRNSYNDLRESLSLSKEEPSAALFSQKAYYSKLIVGIKINLKKIEIKLMELESDIRSKCGQESYFIDLYFKCRQTETQLNDKSFSDKHVLDMVHEILSLSKSDRDTLLESMELNNHLRYSLKGMNRLGDDSERKFLALQKKIEGKKNVVWRDGSNDDFAVLKNDVMNYFRLPANCNSPKSPAHTDASELTTICSGLTPEYNEIQNLKNTQLRVRKRTAMQTDNYTLNAFTGHHPNNHLKNYNRPNRQNHLDRQKESGRSRNQSIYDRRTRNLKRNERSYVNSDQERLPRVEFSPGKRFRF